MDVNLPITPGEILYTLLGFCAMGWNYYLQAEKKAFNEKFKESADRCKALEDKVASIEKEGWTRDDHKEFRGEVLQLIDKMSDSLTTAIEKLSDRLEKFMSQERHG